MKKILILLFSVISLTAISQINRSDDLTPFDWEVISGVEKLVPTKDMSKSSLKKLNEGNSLYSAGIDMMKRENYSGAIEKFKLARKSYKRARITEHDYNYININQALCYAKEKDFSVAKYNISLVTSKIEKEREWLYNLAIANSIIENHKAAISNLTIAIRLDENYFQAYITLEAIHRNMGNESNADKVRGKMKITEDRLERKKNKNKKNNQEEKDDRLEGKEFVFKDAEPDVTTLNIVKGDDNLQFNKVSQIKARSMTLVQEGVDFYNTGVSSLANKNYNNAIEKLKLAEKKLKIGKINNHGLNFSRGQLAIAYLSLGEDGKSKLGQVKRNLRNITNKLYDSRDWTYNMAVVNYDYATKILIRYNKNNDYNDKWKIKANQSEFLKNSIKLFKLTIKYDKHYLTPYQNLSHIYNILGDENKSEKYRKLYNKRRNQLLNSFDATTDGFDREGRIFRIHLGTFGEYEAPADIFDEDYIITVPINERQTAYLVGMFEKFSEAKKYLNKMKERGYKATIKVYEDGDDIEF